MYRDNIRKKLRIAYALLLLFNISSFGQQPVLKVDLNIDSRQESEVNEPGYIPWPISENAASKTIEGITFNFKNGSFNSSWYKTAVQAPYYARLANDGLMASSSVELHISGLQIGTHSMVTFHNSSSNPETNTFGPVDIVINRMVIVDNVLESVRVLSNDLCETAYFEFEVTDSEPVIISFVPENESLPFMLSGFHLNKSDPKKMSKTPYPVDKDEHVDIDNDTLVLSWKSPDSTVSHNVYFGTNESEVMLADTSSPLFLGNIVDTFIMKTGFYSMDSNFWRVDPIDTTGKATKGDLWYFRKRLHAFPGAEGHGGYAIGGRGGKVVYVTNLEDSGPGSFRDAVENYEGPRTILFNVSGLITLTDRLVIRDDKITVAGQTAPGKGVCLRWAPVGVVGDDLIVQNLRVRLGIGITYDGMGLTGSQNSIIDHCSISWTIDESFSSRGAKNITLQRTLISEALNSAGHDNYGSGTEHGYAASIGGDIGSFHHNLLAHCAGRNWSLAGGLDGDGYYAGRLDIFNNLVYNWDSRATDGGAHEVNFVNNYYKMGKASTQTTILRAQLEGVGKGSQSYYYAGNILESKTGSLTCDGTDNTCSRRYELSNGQVLDWEVFVNKPFFSSEAHIEPAKYAYKSVLSDVGCTQPAFDDHDIRIVNETLNQTYTYTGSKTNKFGLPDHESDVGYWEAYPGYVRADNWDSDKDGLPNWWEGALGLDSLSNQGDYSEANADNDKNGYTNLEEYLHWMGEPHYFMNGKDSLLIDVAKYTRGFADSAAYEIVSVENGDATLLEDTSLVVFKPGTESFSELEFKVSDKHGDTLVRMIGIYNGTLPTDSLFTYTYNLGRSGNTIVSVDTVNTIIPGTSIEIEEKPSIDEVKLYPNPANNKLSIDIEATKNNVTTISILDISGQNIFKKDYALTNSGNTINIDIEDFSSGLYLLKVESQDMSKSLKFIKN